MSSSSGVRTNGRIKRTIPRFPEMKVESPKPQNGDPNSSVIAEEEDAKRVSLKEQREARRRKVLEVSSERLARILGDNSTANESIDAGSSTKVGKKGSKSQASFDPPPLGGFTIGLPSRRASNRNGRSRESSPRPRSADRYANRRNTDRSPSPLPNKTDQYSLISEAMASSMGYSSAGSPHAPNPFDGSFNNGNPPNLDMSSLQGLFGGKNGETTNSFLSALNKTKVLRLLLSVMAALLVFSQTLSIQCGITGLDAYAHLVPSSYPLLFVPLTNMAIVVGAYLMEKAWNVMRGPRSGSGNGGSRLKESPFSGMGAPGPAEGMEPLFSMLGRIQNGMAFVALVRSVITAVVADGSTFLVVLCCSISVAQWYYPACR